MKIDFKTWRDEFFKLMQPKKYFCFKCNKEITEVEWRLVGSCIKRCDEEEERDEEIGI